MTLEKILRTFADLDNRMRGVGPHTVEMVLDHTTASEVWAFLRELKSRRDDEMEKKEKASDKRKQQSWEDPFSEGLSEETIRKAEEKMRRDQEEAFRDSMYGNFGQQKGRPYDGPHDNRAPPPGWGGPDGPSMEEILRKMYDEIRNGGFRKQQSSSSSYRFNWDESNPFGEKAESSSQSKKKTDSTHARRPWYEVLGVDPAKCDKATIKSAWRKLAKIHHPDRKGGSVEKMSEINRAKDEGLSRGV